MLQCFLNMLQCNVCSWFFNNLPGNLINIWSSFLGYNFLNCSYNFSTKTIHNKLTLIWILLSVQNMSIFFEYCRLNFLKIFEKDFFKSSRFLIKIPNFFDKWNGRPEVFCKIAILKNSTKFAGKHLYRSLILNKVEGI